MKKTIFGLICALVLVGCTKGQDGIGGDDNGGGHKGPGTYAVKGKVEKGPFISGSTINLQPMNEHLQPVGSTFSTTITDNAGNFSFNPSELDEPYAQLTANGYFFNEVDGKLSKGTLTLRALADLSEQSTVNVNILTHLKYSRILDLVEKDGKSYEEANCQAQQELMKTFGLEKYNNANVSDFNITTGTEEASALLAISSLILYGKNEAEVTEFLANLSDEFGKNGIFSVHSQQRLREDRNKLAPELEKIAANVVKRYAELGDTITVLPLKYQFDWNDDGIAGNELADENTRVELSDSVVVVPFDGGEFTLNVKCDLELFLEAQVSGDDPIENVISQPYYNIYDPSYSRYTPFSKSYQDGILKVSVGRNTVKKEQSFSVPFYDYFGQKVAVVRFVQDGNPSPEVPKLGQSGAQMMMMFFEELSNSFCNMSIEANGMYGPLNSQMQKVDSFGRKAPEDRYDSMSEHIWRGFYQALNYLWRFERADKADLDVYGPYFSVWKALCYYNMTTLWGDLPYFWDEWPDVLGTSGQQKRTAQKEILEDLVAHLEAAVEVLPEKSTLYQMNNYLSSASWMASEWTEFFFASKELARMLLADIYMYMGDYSSALTWLEQFEKNSQYGVTSGTFYLPGESFLGFRNYNDGITGWGQWDYIPVFTMSDVKLAEAECLYFTENEDAAWEIVTGSKFTGGNAPTGGIAGIKQTYTTMPPLYKRMLECSTDLLEVIDDIRFASMRSVVGRFAYLKRVHYAEKVMGLESFQLLWPIPANEVSYWGQNEGY